MKAKYYVYRNLHTGTFSVKHKGRVIDHPTNILCDCCSFVVHEKGRQRVITTKRKNVHALVTCESYVANTDELFGGSITYNPYTHDSFKTDSGSISKASKVLLKNNKMFLVEA